ncbi:hypothetical protein [Halospina sp. K52047b]|uniref:hypothetical protein n=1 Tax=Halospina sp. K52047b TaxID=2614160 RepID=UPI00124A11BA|nr:hypothetical protein [Halospina sp. K52047b]KAA8981915.1 hypothetical protein F3089_09255 [Halospina sp. K52047b]
MMDKDISIRNRPHIIFVLGAGGSGSSLLAALLHQQNGIFSVGELSALDVYIALDRKCSCGEPISECSFWKKVYLDSNLQAYGAPLTPSFGESQLLIYRRSVLRKDPLFLPVSRKNLDVYNQIHEVSGQQAIVDASKDLARFYYLLRSGSARITPIHLVRDGRSYIVSMRERQKMGPVRATVRWARKNLLARIILRKTVGRNGYLLIDFNEFVLNAESKINEIVEHAGLNVSEYSETEITIPHHGLAGTGVREGVLINNLQPKTLDKTVIKNKRLSLYERIIFFMLGGYLLNRFFQPKNISRDK